jgi:hypothetical protein
VHSIKINRIYPWLRLFFSSLLFILYDYLHITRNIFILLFIVIEVFMIISDILLYRKMKVKLSVGDIGLYVFYNYMALRIIMTNSI